VWSVEGDVVEQARPWRLADIKVLEETGRSVAG
jgi:hypothetical protein